MKFSSWVHFVLNYFMIGRQILRVQTAVLDESKNYLGPNRCGSNSECSTGCICVDSWCQDDISSRKSSERQNHQGNARANVDHPYNDLHNKRGAHRTGVERFHTQQVHESDGVLLSQMAISNVERPQEKIHPLTVTQQVTAQTVAQMIESQTAVQHVTAVTASQYLTSQAVAQHVDGTNTELLVRNQVTDSLFNTQNSTTCLTENLHLSCNATCLSSLSQSISNFDATPNFEMEANFSSLIQRSTEPHPCTNRIYQANNYSSFLGACRDAATIQAGSVLLVYACLTDDAALDPLEQQKTRDHFSGFIASHYPADSLVGRAEYVRPAETADLHDDNVFNYRADRPKNRWSRSLPIDFDRSDSERVENYTCHTGGRNVNQLSNHTS